MRQLQPVKTYPPPKVKKMDIMPFMEPLYTEAQTLVARHTELCETAGCKIAEKAGALVGALMPARSAPKHENQNGKPAP